MIICFPKFLFVKSDDLSWLKWGHSGPRYVSLWLFEVQTFCGGIITQYLTWRWIFYINVPICILVLSTTLYFYSEQRPRREQQKRFDLIGGDCAAFLAMIPPTREESDAHLSRKQVTGAHASVFCWIICSQHAQESLLLSISHSCLFLYSG